MLKVRDAQIEDSAVILDLIRGLARYEKLEEYVEAEVSDIEKTLFCDNPKAFALIAHVNGEVAGFALYFFNYSTFLGKHGIYLEDLYVKPEYRSHKVGLELFKQLANIAVTHDCGRIDWSVLDWNQLAIDFYLKLKAKPQTEWTGFRVEGEQLIELSQM